jgi:L-aspartate oxidase
VTPDVLVIGCGIAGATAALRLAADRQREVVVVARDEDLLGSSSGHAQGGIVGRGEDDDASILVEDILRAGAGLSLPAAARLLATQGPTLIEEVLEGLAGVRFDRRPDGTLHLGLEAAHSRRRILHVGDALGRVAMDALLGSLRGRSNVTVLPRRTAVDLITFPHHARDPLAVYDPPACHGAYVLDQVTGRVDTCVAGCTVLASGGLGQIFLNTTNPPAARGDGLAMAARAGATIANAEFVQFHPTALHGAGTTKFLISEAVRGEGGVLLDRRGQAFMERYDPRWCELAPRDVVARAIYWEMLAHDDPYVLLDIASRRPAGWIRERFPFIHAHCLAHGIDVTQQPIPVVPAAHYFCGGVLVDDRGRTSIPGLYAVGEVACTGVHGANRLASTSLLEGVVWGCRAAEAIAAAGETPMEGLPIPPWEEPAASFDADPALIQGDLQTIRNLMWHYVGLVRNAHRLNRAVRELTDLSLNIEEFYRRARLSDGLVGLRNAVQTALLVTRAAQRNRGSRGCHFRDDPVP